MICVNRYYSDHIVLVFTLSYRALLPVVLAIPVTLFYNNFTPSVNLVLVLLQGDKHVICVNRHYSDHIVFVFTLSHRILLQVVLAIAVALFYHLFTPP